jgi:hypothetical protein
MSRPDCENQTLAHTIRAQNGTPIAAIEPAKKRLLEMVIDIVVFLVVLSICYLGQNSSVVLILIVLICLCFLRENHFLAYAAFIAAMILIIHGFVVKVGKFSVSWDTA